MIRRYRLHEVTARMAAGGAIDWAALAADLGYADQGHFIRDFKSMFGEPATLVRAAVLSRRAPALAMRKPLPGSLGCPTLCV